MTIEMTPVQSSGLTIGLDFGTSTTVVGIRQGDALATVLAIGEQTPEMPSLAAYNQRGRLVAGERSQRYPVIRSVKRAIAGADDVVPAVRRGETVLVPVAEVVGTILREAGERAARAGVDLARVDSLRLGCPAHWNSAQRRILRDVAAESGLGNAVPELVDEPVAAGISWVWNRSPRERAELQGRVLVFDYGGGTLDVAVLDVHPLGDQPAISVLSALGVPRAGDALDETIVRDLRGMWADQGADTEGLDDLVVVAARDAKKALSTRSRARIDVGDGTRFLPELTYSREQLEAAFRDQLDEAVEVAVSALFAAELREYRGGAGQGGAPDSVLKGDAADVMATVDFVLLAGGMSQVPMVRRVLGERFPGALITSDVSVASPTYSIASGLSLSSRYERLNLHRPGYDFILEWTGTDGVRASYTLYEAHTPLYDWHEVAAGRGRLGHHATTNGLDLTGSRDAVLRVVAVDGSDVPLEMGEHRLANLPVTIGAYQPVELDVFVDGRLRIREGDGREQVLRAASWPILHTAGGRALEVELVES